MGKQWKAWQTLFIYFFGPKSLQIVTATMKLKDACSLEEKLWQTWALSTEWSRWVMSDSWHPMDCSTPGSSISGIFQRILEWVSIFFSMTNLESILKSGDITLLTKVCLVKVMFFSVVMYGSESCTIKKTEPKNWCFWTVVLEKTLESLLDCKEIQPVNPKGNQSWIFIGRTDAEAETPMLWPPDSKNWLAGKDLDAGKDGRQEEKGMRGWDGWMASRTW